MELQLLSLKVTAPKKSHLALECPAVSGKLMMQRLQVCRCSEKAFPWLSVHGPVVNINKAMHRCLRGQWGKGETREKKDSSFLRMYI